MVAAIESLFQHKPFLSSEVSAVVLEGYLSGATAVLTEETPGGRLTPREREIIQLLAEGKSNKEVSTALNISVKTVEMHRTNIMRKLDFHSISDLVRYAIRNKIIEP